MAKPKAYLWWKRGVDDGAECLRKRRALYFEEYREAAMLALNPGEDYGVCSYIYTRAFRVGYDNAKLKRELDKGYWKRPKKRGSLG